MTKRYQLKRKSCDQCGETYYSRSHRSRWCSGVCQLRNWRANNPRLTKAQKEQQYLAQEAQKEAA